MEYNELLEKISSLVIDYDKKTSSIDKNNLSEYINQLVYIINQYLGLNSYLLGINEDNCRQYNNSSYEPAAYNERTLYIRYNQLFKLYNDLDSIFIKKKDNISFALLITMIISHELNHALQQKMIEDSSYSLEKYILESSVGIFSIPTHIYINPFSLLNWLKVAHIKEFVMQLKLFYMKYHDYAPFERTANIFGYQLLLDLVKYLEIKDLIKVCSNQLEKTYKFGYKNDDTPTKTFFEKANNFSKSKLGIVRYIDIDRLSQESSLLPFYDRLKLGMEISKEEYDEKIKSLIM